MIWAPLQKLPNNMGNLGKIIVAIGFELLPKVQKITQSGHTGHMFMPSTLHFDLSVHIPKSAQKEIWTLINTWVYISLYLGPQ